MHNQNSFIALFHNSYIVIGIVKYTYHFLIAFVNNQYWVATMPEALRLDISLFFIVKFCMNNIFCDIMEMNGLKLKILFYILQHP